MEAIELNYGKCKYCGTAGYIADTDCGGVMIDGVETLPEDGGDFLLADAAGDGRPVCDECANGREWTIKAHETEEGRASGWGDTTFTLFCGANELCDEITEHVRNWVAGGEYEDGAEVRTWWYVFLDLDPDADEYHDTGLAGEETFVYEA